MQRISDPQKALDLDDIEHFCELVSQASVDESNPAIAKAAKSAVESYLRYLDGALKDVQIEMMEVNLEGLRKSKAFSAEEDLFKRVLSDVKSKGQRLEQLKGDKEIDLMVEVETLRTKHNDRILLASKQLDISKLNLKTGISHREALQIRYQNLVEILPKSTVDSQMELGDLFAKENKYEKAREHFLAALAEITREEKSSGPQPDRVANCHASLGFVCTKENAYQEACQHYQKACDLLQSLDSVDHDQSRKLAIWRYNMAWSYNQMGAKAEGLAQYNLALDCMRQIPPQAQTERDKKMLVEWRDSFEKANKPLLQGGREVVEEILSLKQNERLDHLKHLGSAFLRSRLNTINDIREVADLCANDHKSTFLFELLGERFLKQKIKNGRDMMACLNLMDDKEANRFLTGTFGLTKAQQMLSTKELRDLFHQKYPNFVWDDMASSTSSVMSALLASPSPVVKTVNKTEEPQPSREKEKGEAPRSATPVPPLAEEPLPISPLDKKFK